jgi:hypothetical protein
MYVLIFKVNGKIESIDGTSHSINTLKQFAADQFNSGQPYKWNCNLIADAGLAIEDGEYQIIMVDYVLS